MFRDLLTEPRLLVFPTAPWHAERSACMSTFVLQAPRYVMVDGRPVYKDKCVDHWLVRLRYLFTRSAMYSVFFEPVIGGAGPADMVQRRDLGQPGAQLRHEELLGLPLLALP